jgi:hypothetical protein
MIDICFARHKVEAIGSFTEPADVMGLKATHVTFTNRPEILGGSPTHSFTAASFSDVPDTWHIARVELPAP